MTGGDRGLSAPPASPPISALPPRGLPPGRPGWDPLRGEPAITGLGWSFAPPSPPRSWERIAHQNPFGPPRGFRPPASPCPGLDRPVSGLPPVTTGPLRPSPPSRGSPPRYGLFGFPTPSGGLNPPLRLATGGNSPPARVSRRKGRPWTLPPSYSRVHPPGFLRGGRAPFRAAPPLAARFQALFTPPLSGGFFSAFPHGTSALSVSGRA